MTGALTAWVAPSVLGLDRISAATASGAVAFSYTEDFQGAVGASGVAWSTTATETAPADPNRRFLGRFASADSVTVTIALPPHSMISLSFDFLALSSWDGSHVASYNDRFEVGLDGVPIFNESFAQAFLAPAGRLQTYGPNPTNPAGTGAVEVNTLGYLWGRRPADTVYRLEFLDLPHTASTVSFTFSGINLQPLNDESWGIDNVDVQAC